jgi:DNA-binding NtrC family response regulator
MQRYTWPGNVRELENGLERAAILAKGATIPLSALPERVVEPKSDPLVSDAVQANPTLDTIERAYIMWVLENEGGNKARAADVLGIDSSTLYRKLSRYDLDR